MSDGASGEVVAGVLPAFGDKLVNELVEVLNQVNAANRTELRDFMEAGLARLDAKLDASISRLEAKLEARIDLRIGELRAELMQRIAELRTELLQRMTEIGAQIEQRLDERFEKRLSERFAITDARIDRLEKRLDQQGRLFILAWATLMAAVVGMGLR